LGGGFWIDSVTLSLIAERWAFGCMFRRTS
jgi:hypothetical protein